MGNVWILGTRISCISFPLTTAEKEVWKRWGHVLESLHFTLDEFKMLLKTFNKMDRDGSGAITLKEFLYYLQLENNEFFRRAFSILDEDKSGEIDFGEFVISLWNYCTLSEHSLMLFAFDLYDCDLSGAISKDEIKVLIRDLHGGKVGTNKFAKASLARLENMVDTYPCEDEEGLHHKDFVQLVKKYPNLMFAAFEIQNAIRKRVLGHSFWNHLSKQTLELPDGRYVTIAQYKEQNMHKHLLSHRVGKPSQSTDNTSSASAPAPAPAPKRKHGKASTKSSANQTSAASELSKTRASVGTLIGGSVTEAISKHSTKGAGDADEDPDGVEALAAEVWGTANSSKKRSKSIASTKPETAAALAGVNAAIANISSNNNGNNSNPTSTKGVSVPNSSRRTSFEMESEPHSVAAAAAGGGPKVSARQNNNGAGSRRSSLGSVGSVELDNEPYVLNLDRTANRKKSYMLSIQ